MQLSMHLVEGGCVGPGPVACYFAVADAALRLMAAVGLAVAELSATVRGPTAQVTSALGTGW
jgi:hypothetical protein